MEAIKDIPTYSYTPLDRPESIRVLVLHPSEDFSAPLLCDLVHDDRHEILLDLEHKRGYEAVSYTWGDPIFSHEIICDRGTAKITITHIVDLLLRHLRKKFNIRRLWIDAVCLNQRYHGEKKIQVALMGQIYRQARKVHVWLGDRLEMDMTVDSATQSSNASGVSQIMTILRVLSITKEEQGWHFVRELAPSILHGEDQLFSLVQKFLHAPWFQRRWTIQEAALNDHTVVRMGSSKLPWKTMSSALDMLRVRIVAHALALDESAFAALDTSLAIQSRQRSILQLLFQYHRAQCADPRDRIAALWSVASLGSNNTQDRSQPTVDYDRAWEDNYRHFAQNQIESGNLRELFEHLGLFGSLFQTNQSWPSWVPDWSRSRPNNAREPELSHSRRRLYETETPIFASIKGIPALNLVLTVHTRVDDVFNSSMEIHSENLDELSPSSPATVPNIYERIACGLDREAIASLIKAAMSSPLSVACEVGIQNSLSMQQFRASEEAHATRKLDFGSWLADDFMYKGIGQGLGETLEDILKIYTYFRGNEGRNPDVFGLASCDV